MLIMEVCINCKAKELIRHGYRTYKDGSKEQRYKCKECGKTQTEKYKHKHLSEEQKVRIDEMVCEGIGLRKIQRLIKVKNVNTVANYLKKKS
jgi:transposase-like protein